MIRDCELWLILRAHVIKLHDSDGKSCDATDEFTSDAKFATLYWAARVSLGKMLDKNIEKFEAVTRKAA